MSRVVYPARETVTEIRGEDAAEIINKMTDNRKAAQSVPLDGFRPVCGRNKICGYTSVISSRRKRKKHRFC